MMKNRKKAVWLAAGIAASLGLAACGTGSRKTAGSGKSALDRDELFTSRDLEQTVNATDAETITVTDGDDVAIRNEGIYVLRGTAENASVTVDAKGAKVQLLLDHLSITNKDKAAIVVRKADKVFITLAEGSTNDLAVTDTFRKEGKEKRKAVIDSEEDITLNGTGSLHITSSQGAVHSKKALSITGGTYTFDTKKTAVKAEDSIRIKDGTITITSEDDGLHAEHDSNTEKGYVYIGGGTLNIKAEDDCIFAIPILQIDDGSLNLNGHEGLEATWIQINGGALKILARDDGMNANRSAKGHYSTLAEINGGELTISLSGKEADGIDSNGDLVIRSGTLAITGELAIDIVGDIRFTGGTVIFNGKEQTDLDSINSAGN